MDTDFSITVMKAEMDWLQQVIDQVIKKAEVEVEAEVEKDSV